MNSIFREVLQCDLFELFKNVETEVRPLDIMALVNCGEHMANGSTYACNVKDLLEEAEQDYHDDDTQSAYRTLAKALQLNNAPTDRLIHISVDW